MSTAKLVKWFVWQTVRVELGSFFSSLTPSFAHKLWYTQTKKLYVIEFYSQTIVQASKLTKQPSEMVPEFQSTSLYILSYVFTCKSDHFSCSFDLTKFRKKYETNDYVEWKKKRNFTSCGRSSRSTVFWSSPLPANMSITIPFKNCARGRFCWGGGWWGMRYCNVVSEIAISSECECFDNLLVPSSG